MYVEGATSDDSHSYQPDHARVSTDVFARGPGRSRVDIVYPINHENRDTPEEMVFRVQGFVAYSDLPPVTKEPR